MDEARAAVIINDFGESAVDEGTLGDLAVAVREIRGGCVCCTAPEGFIGVVARILDEGSTDRIYVEPTGLARPADLIDTLRRAPFADRLDIRALIVVVDPRNLQRVPGVGAQAGVADVVVANRTDLATDDEIRGFDEWVGSLWPSPQQVHRVEHGRVSTAVLAGSARIQGGLSFAHEHGPVHGHLGHTWIWPPEVCFDRRRLLEALGDLASASRLKGIFRTEEGVSRFDIAGGSLHEAPSDHRRDSRVDVIAVSEALLLCAERGFSQAVRTVSEQLSAGLSVEVSLPDGAGRRFDRAALAALPDAVEDVSVLIPARAGVAARVSAILDAVEVPAGAVVVVVAADGYATPPVPADAVRDGLLVHTLDSGPLPAGKGGPFRLLIPGDAGPGGPCANVKAVVRISLRNAST